MTSYANKLPSSQTCKAKGPPPSPPLPVPLTLTPGWFCRLRPTPGGERGGGEGVAAGNYSSGHEKECPSCLPHPAGLDSVNLYRKLFPQSCSFPEVLRWQQAGKKAPGENGLRPSLLNPARTSSPYPSPGWAVAEPGCCVSSLMLRRHYKFGKGFKITYIHRLIKILRCSRTVPFTVTVVPFPLLLI